MVVDCRCRGLIRSVLADLRGAWEVRNEEIVLSTDARKSSSIYVYSLMYPLYGSGTTFVSVIGEMCKVSASDWFVNAKNEVRV